MNRPQGTDTGRRLAFHGALLFLMTMAYGGAVSSMMTGMVPGHPHVALSAHLTGLMGALWVWGVGWSLPYGQFSELQTKLVFWGTVVPSYTNFVVGAAKAHTDVMAVTFSGDMANNILFMGRLFGVVIPGLIGAAVLVWGLRRANPS